MDFKQLFKDIKSFNIKSLKLRLYKLKVILKRSLLVPFRINYANHKNIKKIPIIINNRNRITYLLRLIEWLEKNGYNNIYIIDNNSTYPPLLKFYESTKYTVFHLNDNVGYLALWKTGIIKQFQHNYYVYTDSDIVPIEECPSNFMEFFIMKLSKYKGIEKIGFGLKIDDLPEHYADKQKVLDWENKFWEKEVEENIFDADLDTTFALYKPYSNRIIWEQKALRTGGKYIAQHLPWYEDSKNDSEETLFYKKTIRKDSSHWIEGEK
ncbi:MAG TPA: glycosyltransferase family A protein [Bacteroidia bacterium]|nr:glycosyltransferase family A protein [Bacteroidia bacterium]